MPFTSIIDVPIHRRINDGYNTLKTMKGREKP